MFYILEVQKYHRRENSLFDHMGYMNKKFKTKKEACDYYDRFNPDMRS